MPTYFGKGAYLALQRDPHRGRRMGSTDLWVIRQQIIRGILLVQLYYRIDGANHEVTLVSIREIDMSLL
jgi:hypothetical protein